MDLSNIDLKKELLAKATDYCAVHGITLGTLGKRMANDRKFFTNMKARKSGCTVDTFQRIMRELSEAAKNPNQATKNTNPGTA